MSELDIEEVSKSEEFDSFIQSISPGKVEEVEEMEERNNRRQSKRKKDEGQECEDDDEYEQKEEVAEDEDHLEESVEEEEEEESVVVPPAAPLSSIDGMTNENAALERNRMAKSCIEATEISNRLTSRS